LRGLKILPIVGILAGLIIIDHFDRYLRLALKAQSQCRATCETLAVLKNPPVFTRQANVVNGPQQVNVNNGLTVNGARARELEALRSELLPVEAHGERLDERTTANPSDGDTALATVGALNGTAYVRGQGTVIEERLPRRGAQESA
jgi:hypothetical protein